MSYSRAIEYLYGLQKHGMKFGLDNIRKLMSAFDNPQRSFRSVHVAGTNGKGSTSAMIASILKTAGLRTGLFSSPHLVSFTERIRINGEEISESDVISLAEEVRAAAERTEDFSPTFFEVVTTMAFLHFRKMGVEWAVIETGLGGRLDATNIIIPEVSVITRIGLDHCEFLGKTLAEIASEKTGIIKTGVPVVSALQEAAAIKVIEKASKERGSMLYTYGESFMAEVVSESLDGISFSYRGEGRYEDLDVPLAGRYQADNASMAMKTVEILMAKYPRMKCDIRSGLSTVQWPGRLEIINDEPPVLIDGAHNPQAAIALSEYLGKTALKKYKRIILVAGVMGDKDVEGILDPLLPVASKILFTAPAYGRSALPERLAALATAKGYESIVVSNVAEAVKKAEELCIPGDLIVITGSFYTIGEAKEFFGNKGVLTKLRE
ncbi:MAG TPA: folylpolyglutamate synthase/dihydrofolate synthase family protein [Candidatus Sulfobium mesophilum]|nr:folylpolyglutamate synthase/dihydrofolate synthase family protein [Candidatus Sulfobium mesophilum]